MVSRAGAVKTAPGKTEGSFADVLSGALAAQKDASVEPQKKEGELLQIGTITGKTSTVSELLHQNQDFRGRTWDILAAPQNRQKDYRSILPGTRIYINEGSGELYWSGAAQKQNAQEVEEVSPGQLLHGKEVSAEEAVRTQAPGLVRLGVIDNETPTVSHLLKGDVYFQEKTWQILAEAVNADKPFHRIRSGSEVFLNPNTMEITWGARERLQGSASPLQTVGMTTKSVRSETNTIQQGPVADLSQAVQPYMGTSYDEINCYELLVKGLEQLDIQYGGSNGLRSRLTREALDRGLPENAYLNGEGIVAVAGSTILATQYSGHADWRQSAQDLISEIEPHLNSGQILSFSTQTRGHTGIVSRQGDDWTFINSGRLNNSVRERVVNMGVGEEILTMEIQNWFKLAHESGEHLQVTLGELNQEKITTALNITERSGNWI